MDCVCSSKEGDDTKRQWEKYWDEERQETGEICSILRSSIICTLNIITIIKSRSMRRAVYETRMGEMRSTYKILVIKPKGKRPLERPRSWWKDSIKMDLREVVLEGLYLIYLTQDRGWWCSCEHGNEPSVSIKEGNFMITWTYYQLLKKDSAPWN
jgi:hypothetical protein